MNAQADVEIEMEDPEWADDVFLGDARYRVAYGGRGSSKSWQFVRELIVRAVERPVRILGARELQKSIKDSIMTTVKDQIELLGLGGNFKYGKTYIESSIGSEFIFLGLRYNASEIKSLEGVDIAYIEEAQAVSDESWKMLIPTIRKPGSEIWLAFNPDLETDPTYQRFVKNTPPKTRIKQVNWQDNPWFPDVLDQERRYLQSVDDDAYSNVWDGNCRESSEAQIFHGKWKQDVFEDIVGMDGPYYGVDWGFSQDPLAGNRMFIHDRKLFITHEAHKIGCEIDDTPKLLLKLPGIEKHQVRADNARPELISHCGKHGIPKMSAAMKWPGSVETGITVLRGFEQIIIHERCKHTIDEARHYSYKIDRLTGDILADIIDANNHHWDAIRYGLSPLIRLSMAGDNKPSGMMVAGL